MHFLLFKPVLRTVLNREKNQGSSEKEILQLQAEKEQTIQKTQEVKQANLEMSLYRKTQLKQTKNIKKLTDFKSKSVQFGLLTESVDAKTVAIQKKKQPTRLAIKRFILLLFLILLPFHPINFLYSLLYS